LRFFPAAAATLQTVAVRWPVAICSGALRAEIEYSLKLLNRLDQVAVIISAEDTTKCKPDPEGYQLALTALRRQAAKGKGPTDTRATDLTDLAPTNCLVVEDSLAGIVSAKSAGMWVVGVPNTYTAPQLFEAGADDVILGLGELTPTWIDRRFA
jgi:beta-phosphoglucomutase